MMNVIGFWKEECREKIKKRESDDEKKYDKKSRKTPQATRSKRVKSKRTSTPHVSSPSTHLRTSTPYYTTMHVLPWHNHQLFPTLLSRESSNSVSQSPLIYLHPHLLITFSSFYFCRALQQIQPPMRIAPCHKWGVYMPGYMKINT